MTTPTYVAGATYNASALGTSHAIDLPDGIVDGSLLLGFIAARHTTTASSTWPTGWQMLVDDAPNGTPNGFVAVAYKRVTTGDSELTDATSSVTLAESSRASGVIFRVAGHHASTDPQASTPVTGTNGFPDPGNLAPAEGGSEDRLWFAATGIATAASSTTPPSGYTDDVNATSGTTSGTRITLHVAHKAATASSEDPGQFTSNSGQWVAVTVGIRPAAIFGATANPAVIDAPAAFPAATAGMSAVANPATIAAAVTVPLPSISGVERYGSLLWDGSEAPRLSKVPFSVDAPNMSELDRIDTTWHVAAFTNPDGDDPATSGGQRDAYLVSDTDGLGVRHVRVPFWGSPTVGETEVGSILPQHGFALRHEVSGGRRRAVVVWQNIFFGVYWSVLAGVWTSDEVGAANFVNRQVGHPMADLGQSRTVTSAVRSSGVVTLTLSATAEGVFSPGSYVLVDVTDAGFDGWHLITSVSGSTVTYAQAGADASGGTGTAQNVFPYDVEARIQSGNIVEVRAKRHADTAWPAWVPYDTAAGMTFPGGAGNYWSAPAAAAPLTGDCSVRVDATLPDWTPGAVRPLAARYLTTGNQRCYMLRVTATGAVEFIVAPNGSTGFQNLSNATVPFTDGQRGAIRVDYDADNGSGSRVASFYTAPTINGPWTQLGTTVTTATAAGIFNSATAVFEVGSINTGALDPLPSGSRVHAVQVFPNLTESSPYIDFAADVHDDASTSVTDLAGVVLTRQGTAAFSNTGKVSTAKAFATNLDNSGSWSARTANPAPTGTDGEFGLIAAHLGSDPRSEVSFGPTVLSTSLTDFDATVTPAVISTAVTLPAATPSVSDTRSPATIAVTVALPAATVTTGATATPATVATSADVPTPSTSATTAVTPATIAATITTPAATPLTGATVTPATTAASVDAPAVGVATGATCTPGPILATVTAPEAAWRIDATVTPDTIGLAATVPDVGQTSGATATPATFTLAAAFPAPTPTGVPAEPTPGTGVTATQLDEVRDWVGSTPDDDVIETVWLRKGTVAATALAILRARRADILAGPSRWSVGNDYSQEHTSEALKAINAQIAQLEDLDVDDPTTGTDGRVTVSYLERCGAGR